MDPKLTGILNDLFSPCADKSFTHVTSYSGNLRKTMRMVVEKWKIEDRDYSTFWPRYCEMVDQQINQTQDLLGEPDVYAGVNLSERNMVNMPIIADLKFEFRSKLADKKYTDRFLYELVSVYQLALLSLYELKQPDLNLITIVLDNNTENLQPVIDGVITINLRLQMPYLVTEAKSQMTKLRPKVIELLEKSEILQYVDPTLVDQSWDEIISKTSVLEPVTLYGSSNRLDLPKMISRKIFGSIFSVSTTDESDQDTTSQKLSTVYNAIDFDSLETYQLEDVIDFRNHAQVRNRLISLETLEENDQIFWLPFILSLKNCTTVTSLKKNRETKLPDAYSDTNQIFGTFEDLEFILGLCSDRRYYQESTWLDIGKALYNFTNGTERGLDLWINKTVQIVGKDDVLPGWFLDFDPETTGTDGFPSFRSNDDLIQDVCTELYENFYNNPITINTLKWYANEDSRDLYEAWKLEKCNRAIEKSLSLIDCDIGEAIYQVFSMEFVCVDHERGVWYRFRDHRWEKSCNAVDLRKAIRMRFKAMYEQLHVKVAQQMNSSSDEDYKSKCQAALKKLSEAIKTIGKQNKLNTFISNVKDLFYKEGFHKLLDANRNLTGMANGIVEVVGNRLIFRKGKPEDYISKSTNIRYNEKYTNNHRHVKAAQDWLDKTFVDREIQHYFKKLGASFFLAGNNDKKFPVFTGEGDNSKSMAIKIIEQAFGEYVIKLPIQMLSEKEANAANASPHLARARATRVAFLDEPDSADPLKQGIIKRYTGGDAFYARKLHEEGGETKATFTPILVCNKVPAIAGNVDRAIVNRVVIVPFLSTFSDQYPNRLEEQVAERVFPKDPNFEEKIPNMAAAILWIFANYYPVYALERLKTPQIITEYTENYWANNDLYSHFLVDTVEEIRDKTGNYDQAHHVTVSDLYSEFKLWYKESIPNGRIPTRDAFKDAISKKWHTPVGPHWFGVKIIDKELVKPPGSITEKKREVVARSGASAPKGQNLREKKDLVRDPLLSGEDPLSDQSRILSTRTVRLRQ